MAKKFDITDFSNLVSLETEQKYPEEVKLLRSVWHLISKGKIEMIMRQAELEPSAKPRSSDEPPEWIQTIRKLKEIDQRLSGINKLPDHLEKQIPKELQVFREFYFSLSEEDQKKFTKQKDSLPSTPKTEKTKKEKYCYECGQIINRSAKFCEHCGTKQPK